MSYVTVFLRCKSHFVWQVKSKTDTVVCGMLFIINVIIDYCIKFCSECDSCAVWCVLMYGFVLSLPHKSSHQLYVYRLLSVRIEYIYAAQICDASSVQCFLCYPCAIGHLYCILYRGWTILCQYWISHHLLCEFWDKYWMSQCLFVITVEIS